MIRHALLDEPTFSAVDRATRARTMLTLPGVFAALVRNEIDDFPALRPHQRHVWHALLVQIAALHLLRSGLPELPATEMDWRAALLALTPNDSDGAAWALVTPIDRPAFLQPPVPEGSLSNFAAIATPDALDMLVTAKNHDVKQESMHHTRPEHWVFALVSLQTQEGFLGAGNYGVSRMNGGFASRPSLGIAPPGGAGARLVRDARRLIELRPRMLDEYDFYPSTGGSALLWLYPWDGLSAISPRDLDIFYIEVCRRRRLITDEKHGLSAVGISTKSARIDAKPLKGCTGDGWTPLIVDGADRKALTIDAGSFGYKRIAMLVFPRRSTPNAAVRAPLQEIAPHDDVEGLTVLARGVVRGQGKTEGFHERRIAISASLRRFLVEQPTDEGAAVAAERVQDAGTIARKVLYPAALTAFTAAPVDGERKRDDETAKKRAGRTLDAFDQMVDQTFFEALSDELAVVDSKPAADEVRARWLMALMEQARDVLDRCVQSAPAAAMRGYRTRARARDVLEYAFRKHFGDRIHHGTDLTGESTEFSRIPALAYTQPQQT